MPPLLKLWLDDVLAFGWAYGPDGTALRGKDLWLVASTGGAEDSYRPDSYNRYFFDAFMPPYEQTAALCGMRFLPPLLMHGAHKANDARSRDPRRDLCAAAGRLSGVARARAGRGLRRLRGAAERAPGRPRQGSRLDGTRLLDHRQSRLPRRGGARRADRALPRPRLDHRLPRRRHPDRPVGAEARDAARGDPADRRVRRRPDAVPGRPRARAAAALGAEKADLRLGQRPAVRLGAAARPRRARLRRRLAPGGGRRARPGDVVDGDRPRRPRPSAT